MKRYAVALTLCLTAAYSYSTSAAPFDPAATYQGRIYFNGAPLNQAADIRFELVDEFDVVVPGSAPLVIDYTPTGAGLFTTELDFGPELFDGQERYLRIGVRVPPGGAGAFTALTPNQRISPTPYALQTRGIFVNDDLDVGIGTTAPDALVHVRGASNAAVSGGGLLIIEAQLGGNQLAFDGNDVMARNAGAPNALHLNRQGGNVLLVESGPGNVGIGTTTPDFPLDVETGLLVAINGLSTASGGTGVWGRNTAAGAGAGVRGQAIDGVGVWGVRGLLPPGGLPDDDSGVHGANYSTSNGAIGVKGSALGQATGTTYGVLGETRSMGLSVGVRGECCTSGTSGGQGECTSQNPICIGVQGDGELYGVHGMASNLTTGEGVRGEGRVGVYGVSTGGVPSTGVLGDGSAFGVRGRSNNGEGVYGESTTGHGVQGFGPTGVLGNTSSSTGYAGYFIGPQGSSSYFERRVGIGVLSPTSKLHVDGNVRIDGGNWLQMYDGTAETVRIDSSGASGGGSLNLFNPAHDEIIELDSVDEESGGGGAIRVGDDMGGRGVEILGMETNVQGGIINIWANTGPEPTIELDGEEGDSAVIRLRRLDGTTGITLDADWAGSGDSRIVVDELQIEGGSDLSEQFDITASGGELRAGMVVCIDSANPGKLVVSSRAYDRTVAGVISGANGVKTGLYMGQKGSEADGTLPVALTGRVYCYGLFKQ